MRRAGPLIRPNLPWLGPEPKVVCNRLPESRSAKPRAKSQPHVQGEYATPLHYISVNTKTECKQCCFSSIVQPIKTYHIDINTYVLY